MYLSGSVCMCVCGLYAWGWGDPHQLPLTPLACFPVAPPSFSLSVDTGRDGQPSFRISWLGKSGALKREQLYPEVDTEGSGLCSALWCPRP